MTNTPHDAERLLELVDRCEKATADEQRELLEQAMAAIHPGFPVGSQRGAMWPPQLARFQKMLDAEAYESAAMTLVPEGWPVRDLSQWNESWTVSLDWPGKKYGQVDAEAKTAALALCAAALLALAT